MLKKTTHALPEIHKLTGHLVLYVGTLPILLLLGLYPKEITQNKGKGPCSDRMMRNWKQSMYTQRREQ